ncbi:MAG: efflux RND transporter periplasmic adaptor subunit [Bacillota bacterium]|nr:efflux RND transporter periplasmic adaptor subunit [Bacillota bacterium]
MIRRVAATLAVVLVVLGGGYLAYRQLLPPPVQTTQAPLYATATVARGDISVGVDTTGPLNPAEGSGLMVPFTPGQNPGAAPSYVLQEMLVHEGDPVRAGQVVARLAAPALEQQLQQDSQTVQQARLDLAQLLGVTPEQVDGIDPARGITVTAPIDGRVTGLSATLGSQVKQGQLLAQVVDDSHFVLVARVAPGELAGVRKGETAYLRFDEFDGLVPAQVTDVNPNPIPTPLSELNNCSPAAQSDSGGQASGPSQFVYWVTLEGVNPGLLRPGMQAQVGFAPGNPPRSPNPDSGQPASLNWLRYCQQIKSYGQSEALTSPADASVTRIFVQDGQPVHRGDPILTLAGSTFQSTVEAKLQTLRDAEQKLAQDQAQASLLEVRSPMDGIVVGMPPLQPGATLQPGQYLGQVLNTAHMQLFAQVSDVDIVKVKQGASVQVTVDALPGRVLHGTVTNVAMMGKDQSGVTQFQVLIQVDGVPELRPGMQARAHIDAGSAKDALLVPVEAIFEEDGQSKVEVLEKNGTTRTVVVKLGLVNDRYAQVLSGLKPGDRVITGSSADLLPSQHLTSPSLLPGSPGSSTPGGQGAPGGSGGGAPGGGSPGGAGGSAPGSGSGG